MTSEGILLFAAGATATFFGVVVGKIVELFDRSWQRTHEIDLARRRSGDQLLERREAAYAKYFSATSAWSLAHGQVAKAKRIYEKTQSPNDAARLSEARETQRERRYAVSDALGEVLATATSSTADVFIDHHNDLVDHIHNGTKPHPRIGPLLEAISKGRADRFTDER